MSDRHAAAIGEALVLVPAFPLTQAASRARSSLAGGAKLVERLYGRHTNVSEMVALSVLRELDLLLGLAIDEAAAGHSAPSAASRAAHIRRDMLMATAGSGEALRLIARRRRRLSQKMRAVSAVPRIDRPVAEAILAAAGQVYAALAAWLLAEHRPSVLCRGG